MNPPGENANHTQPDTVAPEVYLGPKEWGVLLAVLAAVLLLGPVFWRWGETFNIGEDFRLDEAYRDDYWLQEQWIRRACREDLLLVIGDSVVWGRFVDDEHTLPARLNAAAGENRFANLGIDGLHWVGLYGLLEHYGAAIRDRRVLLYWNPIWWSRPAADLSLPREQPVHHPRLLPQWGEVPSYHAGFIEKVGVNLEQNLDFLQLLQHWRRYYLENRSLAEWLVEYPLSNPLERFSLVLHPMARADRENNRYLPGREIPPQDWPWVMPGQSLQWKYLRKCVTLLQERGNGVALLAGPLNQAVLTPASRERYREFRRDVLERFEENGYVYFVAPELPERWFADASHPLAAGYESMAQDLWGRERFIRWCE